MNVGNIAPCEKPFPNYSNLNDKQKLLVGNTHIQD